jgi:PadR family transcriptional regulator
MPPRDDSRSDLLPGTLELLILRTLSLGRMHGYGIAQHIQRVSEHVLQVGEGSLYPALQRMKLKGWVSARWARSQTNRRVRYYELTSAGRRQLGVEEAAFDRMVGAITRVLTTD